ncbi:site-specific DNA-methyltransferase [Anaerovibrio lipolyticus]|uniref:site-specific DNA-methyltransferase n=1 Tax=Anaerovibrio lipolyticus TaxID=82374 RepID=UPI0004898F63|nr:DNA methyltransferase [Anaerovibrio lipolyticus]
MAAIDDLIAQINNPELRDRIQKELKKVTENIKFGLKFERHLPERTPLYDIPVNNGSTVARHDDMNSLYKVLNIEDGIALCVGKNVDGTEEISVDDLVTVAEFGESIYPYLEPLDSVENAPDSGLWHTLIEADNYHALQLLDYLYHGKVDCIYIDPPYNTGAKDWKYNNDYVDGNDSYRHSKWLSMMEKRLLLAKKLLNPKDSVLIVTIDEKEYLHLGCLLEGIFPEARIQMISTVINHGGVARGNEFSRSDEYIFFVMFGVARPAELHLGEEWLGNVKNTTKNKLRWREFRRSGSHSTREERPGLFYPIFVNEDGRSIHSIGETYRGNNLNEVVPPKGTRIIWPLFPDGREGCWVYQQSSLKGLIKKGYIRLGKFTNTGMSISYIAQGEQQKVENGEFEVIGRADDGSIMVDEGSYQAKYIPSTNWSITVHNASEYGSKLLNQIFATNRFSFPKSIYSVHDAIRFFVSNKQGALILDFFAGSGTTLHAVNLLNAEDGGNRRCIMVTNNEVSDDEAKALTKQGHKPGDDEWNKLGIARYVTWPRTVCSIEGHDIKGQPLKGNYIGSDRPMADGFHANANFFKLGFLDKMDVYVGTQLEKLIPVLWLKANAVGKCPSITSEEDYYIFTENRFAILINESRFKKFKEKIAGEDLDVVYIVTNFEPGYIRMRQELGVPTTYQLYRDYLDNFRINQR